MSTKILSRISPKTTLLAMVFLQILIHLPMLHLPPSGQQTWRQVVGYSAARAYYQENANFFSPRSDIRLSPEDSGEIYHEFPLIYWLIGQSYHVFGENHYTARLLPLLFNIILIFSAYYFARGLGYSERRSLWFSLLISASPIFIYYLATPTPDLPGLVAFVTAVAFLLSSLRPEKLYPRKFWLSMACLLLATLMKPTYLFYGLPIAVLILHYSWQNRSIRTLVHAGIAGFLILAANGATISHARSLYEAAPPERAIHTPIGPAESAESWQQISDNVLAGIFKWFFEMEVNHAALPFFLIGLWLVFREKSWRTRNGLFWLGWTTSLLIYASFFVVRLKDHDYYIMSALPLAAFFSAKGVSHVIKERRIALGIAVVIMAVGFFRVEGRWFKKHEIPSEFMTNPDAISRHIPEGELILVSGDKSPIIFLYYLRRHGLSIGTLAANKPLQDVDLSHFSWLVDYEPAKRLTKEWQSWLNVKKVAREGNFTIYQIEPPR